MNATKEIQIVGGGLAGLTLGLMLRRSEIPVRVHEAGSYPRHRVCGEFISGRGRDVLARHGLLDVVMEAEAIEARTVGFHWKDRRTPVENLPTPALCISRYALDAALATALRSAGGTVQENQRWKDAAHSEGVVRATGRKPAALAGSLRMIGLKAHARGIPLEADLEMHFRPDGYVGLCRLADGLVNVCGLFRLAGPAPDLANEWKTLLAGPPGALLHQRLGTADFHDGSFCAVAGLSLQPMPADPLTVALGDAFGMISPVTGNGMSLAIESASLAVTPLAAYACGQADWNSTKAIIHRDLENGFRSRLRWAGLLHRVLFSARASAVLFGLGRRFPGIWRSLYRRTH